MGVLKNDVGRPSNKTIIIRRILKVVVLLIIIALAFLIGYNLKDKNSNNPIKSSGKKIQSDDSIKTSKEELQLDDSIVKKLYSEVENVSFYEKIDGNIDEKQHLRCTQIFLFAFGNRQNSFLALFCCIFSHRKQLFLGNGTEKFFPSGIRRSSETDSGKLFSEQ